MRNEAKDKDLQRRLTQAEQERDAANSQLKTARQQNQQLQERTTTAEDQVTSLYRENTQKDQRIADLERELAEVRAQLKGTQAELTGERKAREQLEKDLKQASETFALLHYQAPPASLQARLAKKEGDYMRQAMLVAKLPHLETINAALAEENAILRGEITGLQGSKEEAAQLRLQLAEAEESIRFLEQSRETLSEEAEVLATVIHVDRRFFSKGRKRALAQGEVTIADAVASHALQTVNSQSH